MARSLRIELSGGVYHVTSRGDRREDIYFGDSDRETWLQTDWILGQFAQQRRRAIEKYIDFVRAGIGLPSVWEALRHQIYLGSEPFVADDRGRYPLLRAHAVSKG